MHRFLKITLLLPLLLISGCTGLINQTGEPINRYLLEAPLQPQRFDPLGPALLVSPMAAAPGYHSTDMLYLRTPHKLERFAHHQWADTPARMLQTILVNQAEASGLFSAVHSQRLGGQPQLRLESELLLLHQTFLSPPSQVELAVRLSISDDQHHRIIASRLFPLADVTPQETPAAGVITANQLIGQLQTLVDRFLRDACERWEQDGR